MLTQVIKRMGSVTLFVLLLSSCAASSQKQTQPKLSQKTNATVYSPFPENFTFTSREWIQDDLPDHLGVTVTVETAAPHVKKLTYTVDPNFLPKNEMFGESFPYNFSKFHQFIFCVSGSMQARAGKNAAWWGANFNEPEQYKFPIVMYLTHDKNAIQETSSKIKWLNTDESLNYAVDSLKDNCSNYIKPQYLW